MKRSVFAALLLSATLMPAAFGYIRLTSQPTADVPTPVVISRPDAGAIQFYINNQLLPGGSNFTIFAPGSDPVGAARAALATWNASGANIKFLPLKTTALVHDPQDGNMVIALATTAADISFVGGAVAVTDGVYVLSSGQDPYNSNLNVVAGSLVDSDIMLNPTITFNTDGTGSGASSSKSQDFQAVITHELGHSLGANHTGLLGATMFQYAAIGDRYPSIDDLTFVKAVYPPSGGTGFGTISGTITNGGSPVAFGMLTMIDAAQKITIGGLTASDGTYSVQVPSGNYVVYAEPFNAIVQAGNLYLTQAQAAQVSTFQTTFYGGFATPTSVNVTAGNTSTVSFSVTAGSSTLAPPYYGFGAAGAKGDVATFSSIGGPLAVASNQSIDFVFGGPGFDGTLTLANIAVLGGGVTAAAITKDTTQLGLNNTGYPLQRLTLSIASTQTSTPATIVISKGGAVLSLSALFVVTPATPAFTSASLVSAAGYATTGAAVSPGGIVALFASPGSSNLGPATPVLNAGYDPYGYLSGNLAGVTVTFDGVPAPLFFVYGGQINLQVPFEVAGKTNTNVAVSYFGAANKPVAVPVVPIQPAIFTFTAGGTDSIVVNQDYSINSASKPAAQGSYVTIYGTGVGVTSLGAAAYGLATGLPAPGLPSGYTGNFKCTIGSTAVNALFGGWTPTSVGLAQWNVQIPTGATGQLNLKCTDVASGTSTQTGAIYVN